MRILSYFQTLNTTIKQNNIPNLKYNQLKKDTFSLSGNTYNTIHFNTYDFKNLFFKGRKKPVYAIDKDGKYTKFNTEAEASKVLNVNINLISKVTTGKSKTSAGYIFVSPDKIETKDKDGKTILDKTAIDILQRVSNSKFFYAIKGNGEYEKFYSKKEASKKLQIPENAIYHFIKYGNKKPCNGIIFIPANKIETRDTEGNIEVSINVIQKFLKKFNMNVE